MTAKRTRKTSARHTASPATSKETINPRTAGTPVNVSPANTGIHQDISELQVTAKELRDADEALLQTQSRLHDERERYRQLFEYAPDGYLVTDRNGAILEANKAMSALLQHQRAYLTGKPVVFFIPEGHRSAFRNRINSLLRETHVQEWETVLQPHRSAEMPVLVRVSPILNTAGEVAGLRWLVRDITARKLADSALWNERNFVSAILDTTTALMVVMDTDGRIVRFNRACELLTGFTQEEIRGTLIWNKLLIPEEITPVQSVFAHLLAGNFPGEYENYWLSKNGGKLLIRWSNSVMHDNTGNIKYVIATGVDITAQRKAEEKARLQQEMLAHSMRVSTMGEMASGLAHEINQPLAAIINYAHGCLQRLEGNPADHAGLHDALRQIDLQAQRAAGIVQHLRHFVAKGDAQRLITDINKLISEAIKFVETGAGETETTIHLDLAELPPVPVDDVQIQQVLLNLLRNSIDAVSQCPAAGRRIDIKTVPGDDQLVEVTIRDNGVGMTQDVLDKAFDPFYTTKENGMGLGLAISRTIIEDHGGQLWVTPNPDQGVSFHFTLPLKSPNHAN